MSLPKMLFLDDDQARHDYVWEKLPHWDITSVYDTRNCQYLLATQEWDLVSLDHDIGDGQTGYDVVAFMATLPDDKRPKYVNVHSYNPVGRERMVNKLKEDGYVVFDYMTHKLTEVLNE